MQAPSDQDQSARSAHQAPSPAMNTANKVMSSRPPKRETCLVTQGRTSRASRVTPTRLARAIPERPNVCAQPPSWAA